jgi:hypothetical protein
MRARAHTWLVVVAALGLATTVGGCGLGAGKGTSNAAVVVTENFGAQTVGQANQKHVPGSETVLQFLERKFSVATEYGGDFVESIDGRSGSSSHLDWFYYVNGIEAPKGAARTDVYKGDRIWWDRHDWSATDSVPAVVGSFPEPFTTGTAGRKFPTVLSCGQNVTASCDLVAKEMRRQGVNVGIQLLGGGSGSDSLAIIVGTWADLRGVIATDLIESGPKSSGVYAEFVGTRGQAIELDNPNGSVVQTLHGTAGLIAATEQPGLNEPVWLVTGTNTAGVAEAAKALTPATLHDHFALALSGGRELPVPLDPGQ